MLFTYENQVCVACGEWNNFLSLKIFYFVYVFVGFLGSVFLLLKCFY